MMAERGVGVDYSTLYRWVQRYAPELEKRVRWYQGYRSSSWRVDETYVRVGGKWKYLFRAVDKHGRLIDFMLSDRRNTKAARRFLAKALKVNAQLAAGVDHHRQACFLSEGPAPAETEERAERHGPAPDVEVPQQQDRGRSWCAQTADPSHQGLPVDEEGLCHNQGLRDHA